jgi:carbon monoxide dehydrogenase subunit G
VPRLEAERELLAPPADVWKFISDPGRIRDWWPGISGLQVDRLGFAPGARWQVTGDNSPSFLRRPSMTGMLLVRGIAPERLFAFHLTGDRIDVELHLEPSGETRTRARLVVNGPALIGLKRNLPRQALDRLHDRVQTAADL